MATTLAQLDSALQQNTAAVQAVVADVTALIAKLNAGEDFSSELETVQSSLSGLQGADAAAQQALVPAPPVTPAQ